MPPKEKNVGAGLVPALSLCLPFSFHGECTERIRFVRHSVATDQ